MRIASHHFSLQDEEWLALERPVITSQDALLGKTFIILFFKAHTHPPQILKIKGC